MDGGIDEWIVEGQMDGWMEDGWTDEWKMDSWMDGLMITWVDGKDSYATNSQNKFRQVPSL